MIKIAVIGGGTAGHIAAAHVTKYFPQFELHHIYDSSIPTIGVGEGTTLNFPEWLTSLTGLDEVELEARCHMTRKFGIKFENWGSKNKEFLQHFQPRGAYAYHVSADEIVQLLRGYISANHIDKKVLDLQSDSLNVAIAFADGTHLAVDFAIDARGFPKILDEDHINVRVIPTNSAVVRQGPAIDSGAVKVRFGDRVFTYRSATRAVARPHGWMFVIPLTNRTSYGYIYNRSINSPSDIDEDFDVFLAEDGVEDARHDQYLQFPNFACRRFFDGALFKIGNAASFLEPLEATAIGVIVRQMTTFSYWPLGKLARHGEKVQLRETNVDVLNNYLSKSFQQISLFVAWHYAMGSQFDSPFWRYARSNFDREIDRVEHQSMLGEFKEVLARVRRRADPFENFQGISLSDDVSSETAPATDPGKWEETLLAELGYGIGYFP